MFRMPQIRLWKIASAMGLAVALTLAAAAAHAADANFDRTLKVSGQVDLTINTGSGHIHLKRGPAGSLHISGRVRPGWGQSDDRAREIAAHPPIQQTGNIVHIGFQHDAPRNIAIDYDVEAPDDAIVAAATGSGDIAVDGVGQNVRIRRRKGGNRVGLYRTASRPWRVEGGNRVGLHQSRRHARSPLEIGDRIRIG